jgi:hypothetical protein
MDLIEIIIGLVIIAIIVLISSFAGGWMSKNYQINFLLDKKKSPSTGNNVGSSLSSKTSEQTSVSGFQAIRMIFFSEIASKTK